MTESNEKLKLRRQIGIGLRFPVVAVLALLWLVYLWWWLAAIGLAVAVAMLVLRPLAYPPLYVLTYLELAFSNSNEPVLPGYFDRYPDKYIEWCEKSIKLGFPTLKRWLREGFG
jgi:hypothetical protein